MSTRTLKGAAPSTPDKQQGTPSPVKKKKAGLSTDFYEKVDAVFGEFSVESRLLSAAEGNISTAIAGGDDEATPSGTSRVVPVSVLKLALSRLHIHITDADVNDAAFISKSPDSLDRDEFVHLVHKHLRNRTTAEEVIFNVVQLDPTGSVPANELRALLQSKSLFDEEKDANQPLTDSEFDALLDRIDRRHTGVVHVGCFVRVMCPDEEEVTIEILLEKYGVGESRRRAQREQLEIEETIHREQSKDEQALELEAVASNMKRERSAIDALLLSRERERQAREQQARDEEERRRAAAAAAAKRKHDEEMAAARAAALAAEQSAAAAAEAQRRRNAEAAAERSRQEKVQPGCCRIDHTRRN